MDEPRVIWMVAGVIALLMAISATAMVLIVRQQRRRRAAVERLAGAAGVTTGERMREAIRQLFDLGFSFIDRLLVFSRTLLWSPS